MHSLTPDYLAKLRFDTQQLATLRALGEYRGKQLLYVAQSPEVLSDLRQVAVVESTESSNRLEGNGAVQKFLPLGALRDFPVIPFNDEKKKLVKVLETLDAKIDCNNRINAELEAMAKTLYDYWFVQFDFSDANGKPYKSSDGKMVYNAMLKREIPVEWTDSNILAVADLLGGGTPTKKKPEYWNGSIPFFTPTDADGGIFKFATADYITEEGLKGSSTKLFGKNTVFITARGSVGKLVFAGVDMAMNQSCYP